MAGTIAKMVAAATQIDKANTGYDQWQRWSFFDRKKKKLIPNAEGDCSSVCGAIVAMGGYPVDLSDTFYTGTFKQRLERAGFKAIKFTSLAQLRAGDFVLSVYNHVEFVPAVGRMFSANIDENGRATGGKAGDQTGHEVSFKPAYVYSRGGWDWIMRPPADPKPPAPSKTVAQLADEVLAGKWGNDPERSKKLKAAGYDSNAVQKAVNNKVNTTKPALKPALKPIATIAKEVIAGEWGNGADRAKRLKAAGYNATKVQDEVNKQLAANKKSVTTLAHEVIAGRWGVDPARTKNLTAAGYNAKAVQAEVNRLLKG